MLEVALITKWTLKKLQEYLSQNIKRCWLVNTFLFELQPRHYLMIRWAEPNELATLLSQCAKQTLALVGAAPSLSLQQDEWMKDIHYVLLEGLDELGVGLLEQSGEE